ncbi:MAG: ABC transporter ATP-binding protein [Bacteroidetes bacterium]|nr:ABC transporter ATP-binding protein [Bacteroidota bacterium]
MYSRVIIQQAFRSFGILLTPGQKVKTWLIYFYSTLVAFADIIGLGSMIPVLMLAIDHSFLEKSRKLQAIFHYFHFQTEAFFLKILIAFILVFFLIKSIAAIWLYRYIRRTAIQITQHLSSSSFDYAFKHNSYGKVASDGLGFNDTVMFTPYYFVSGVYIPFINLVSETAVVVMLVLVFTVYKPALFFLIVGLLGTAFFLVNRYTRNKITRLGEEGSKHRETALNDLNLGISGFTDIRAHGVEEFFKKRFLKHYSGYVVSGIKSLSYQLVPARINEIVALLGIIFLVIYGYFFSGDNLGNVRVIAALFAIAIFRLIPAANRLLQSMMHLKLNGYTIQKLIPIAKNKNGKTKSIQNFSDKIEIQNLDFSYNTNQEVFQNLNLTILKGDCIGISGPSGSGKTTLAKLLLGFFQANKGEILIDGVQLDESLNVNQLFSYMGQEPFLLNATVLENVALGISADEVDKKKVIDCLQQAAFQVTGIKDILQLKVGESGALLSEGQKQRLVLARELYRNASVILMDEPTSALDAIAEKEVMETLEILKKSGKTLVIIAHRERIFEICTSVYKLENKTLTLQA